MTEEMAFLKQAVEALLSTSTSDYKNNNKTLNPTIKELLTRVKLSDSILNDTKYYYYNGDKKIHEDQIPRNFDDKLIASPALPYDSSLTSPESPATCLIRNTSTNFNNNNKKAISDNYSNMPIFKKRRRYTCHDCKLEFQRSSDLRRHEKIHLSVLPNICPKCGKGFARKDALKRHFGTLTCRRNRNKLLVDLVDENDNSSNNNNNGMLRQ